MRATPSLVKSSFGLLSLALVALSSANAQVLTLDFADGNGTTSVDQFQGIAGSGWRGGWINAAGTGVTSYGGNVTNTSPLTSGGGNYLSMNFSVVGGGGTGTQFMRLSRQIDNTAISLTSAVAYSFTLRPDSPQSSANESLTIFSGTSANQSTGPSDTWRITSSGSGWSLSNGDAGQVSVGLLGSPNNMSGTAFQFSILSDPTTKTYVATITNLTNNQSFTSAALAWRSGTTNTENTYLNFASVSNASTANTFGYSLDGLSVAPVPEPGTVALATLGGLTILVMAAKRRRLAC